MTFEEECAGQQCSWQKIFEKNIYGPFAPRSGWIDFNKKIISDSVRKQRRNGFLQTIQTNILAIPKSNIARFLKKQETIKHSKEELEFDREQKMRAANEKHAKLISKLKYGQISEIFCGSKVFYARG